MKIVLLAVILFISSRAKSQILIVRDSVISYIPPELSPAIWDNKLGVIIHFKAGAFFDEVRNCDGYIRFTTNFPNFQIPRNIQKRFLKCKVVIKKSNGVTITTINQTGGMVADTIINNY